jgi:hypothetical protein
VSRPSEVRPPRLSQLVIVRTQRAQRNTPKPKTPP